MTASAPPSDPQTTTSGHVPLVHTWVRHARNAPTEYGFEPACTCDWFGEHTDTIVAAARAAHDHARMAGGPDWKLTTLKEARGSRPGPDNPQEH